MTFEEYNEKKQMLKDTYNSLAREINVETETTVHELRKQIDVLKERIVNIQRDNYERKKIAHGEYARRAAEIDAVWRNARMDNASRLQAWVARDEDGSLYLFASEPTFDQPNGLWTCQGTATMMRLPHSAMPTLSAGSAIEVSLYLHKLL